MKITIYTITDCQFSKQEKDYLALHNIQFEEKNLEQNKDWLTEMLAVSNNFAGTPVTRIEKDDGSVVVLKGFTKDEFDQTLGFAPAAQAPVATPAPAVAPAEPAMPAAPPAMPEPISIPEPVEPAPVMPSAPMPEPVSPQVPAMPTMPEPMAQTPAPAMPEPISIPEPQAAEPQPAAPVMPAPSVPQSIPTPQNATQPDPLDAILNDLQAKVGSISSEPTTPAPVENMPSIPEPDFKDKT